MRRTMAVLILTFASVSPSYGMALRWSGGGSDLQTAVARSCTLLVQAGTPEETLPEEWRLIWVGSGEPLSINVLAPSDEWADVCELRRASTAASTTARADTVLHCSIAASRPNIARYVIDVAGDTRVKIALLTAGDSPGVPQFAGEATINGGVADPYPPLATSLKGTLSPGRLTVEASGRNLAEVTRAALVIPGAEAVSFQIAGRTDGLVILTANLRQPPLAGVLELSNASGMAAALTFDPATMLAVTGTASDHFLMGFSPGSATPPSGVASGVLQEFTFSPPALSSALAAAGVVQLERLFPWFREQDVETTNQLGEPIRLENMADVYVARVAAGVDAASAYPTLNGQPGVMYAEADVAFSANLFPDDPLFPLQWGLNNTGQSICQRPVVAGIDIDAPAAWNLGLGAPDVSIAILDTGIDNTHVELSQRTVLDTSFVGYTSSAFDDDSQRHHGTAVAGIAGATINNTTGVAGVAPLTTLHAIKVLGSDGYGPFSGVAQGVDWARNHGYPIINMSLGNLGAVPLDSLITLRTACYNAYLSGTLLVAAAGNAPTICCPQGSSYEAPFPVFPAAYSRRVLGVGAVNAVFPPGAQRWSDRAIWSSFCNSVPSLCFGSNFWHPVFTQGVEPFVDLVAPGGRFIVTTAQGPNSYYDLATCTFATTPQPGAGHTGFGGTSAAAPVVSGAAALVRSRFGLLIGDELEHVLKVTASSQGLPFTIKPHNEYGWGIVKPDAAINYLSSPNVLTRGRLVGDSLNVVNSTPVSVFFRNVPGLGSGTYSCTQYRLLGSAAFFFYTSAPDVWVRGSGSAGASDSNDYNAHDVVPWGRVLSVSQSSATFETFVYEVPGYGWIPNDTASAAIAWSAVGPTNVVGVGDTPSRHEFALRAAPNPVSASIRVELDLPERGFTTVALLDISGRVVARLTRGVLDKGPHQFRWDGRSSSGRPCPAGVYFVRAEHQGRGLTRRLVMLQGSSR